MNRRQFLKQSLNAAAGAALLHFRPLAAETSGDIRYPIGIFTRPWANFELETAFSSIAEAGFQYVGLMTTRSREGLVISIRTPKKKAQRISRLAQDHGLKVVAIYGGDFNAEISRRAAVDGLKKLLDNVAACNGYTLILGGTGDAQILDNYYAAVSDCCDHAVALELKMVLKPHGGLNATGTQCRELIQRINHPAFRLWYDPGNIYYYSDGALDPVQDAQHVNGIVTGICVKDYLHPKEVMVTPGEGLVNFPGVLQSLHEGGFDQGPLVIECLQDGDLPHLVTAARKARIAVSEWVKSIS
ncbi:MAG: sugar phosphate isomerase/epimerase [Calditrichaeota bacterium]|nr:MAG: sugar phosphate isomerase/epimerase [Calditrichota bacterium]